MMPHPLKHAPKVLILGCDETQRLRLSQIICEYEDHDAYRIIDCNQSDEAMKMFKREHPDLVIVEGCHEDGYGWDLCRFIREHEGDRHTGIIFKASRSGTEDKLAVTCLEMGADDFVRYGCSAAELSARIQSVLRLKATTDTLRSVNHKLAALSLTDDLTGLANMRCFSQRMERLRRQTQKDHSGIAVFMVDLDHFKQVNDRFNHLVGSHVIAETGGLIKELIRDIDDSYAARYGGDEFIIAVRASNPEFMHRFGEKLRHMIEFHTFVKEGRRLQISCSVGGAFINDGESISTEQVIKAADKMLYESKANGRNQVSCCEVNSDTREIKTTKRMPAWQVSTLLGTI
jgi:diguanylate cyclase (GGDEF)-like protein